MKNIKILSILAFSSVAFTANAALIASYDFETYTAAADLTGNDATITSDTDTLLGADKDRVYDTASTLVLPTGIDSVSTIAFTPGELVAGVNKVTTNDSSQRFRWRTQWEDAFTPADGIFTVGITSGYELSNFTFSLDYNGNSATATFDLLYDTGSGFQTMTALQGDPSLNVSTTTFTSDTIATAVTGSVVFKIAMTNGNTRASQWDNIQINGNLTPVPEPSSSALLGAFGLLALLRRRR